MSSPAKHVSTPPVPTVPTLYTRPYSSSGRVSQLILELGLSPLVLAQFEVPREILTADPAFLARNPQALVPFFEDPGSSIALAESGAIMQLILEKYDLAGSMGPRADNATGGFGGQKRAELLQWLHYGPATAWPTIVQIHGLVYEGGHGVGHAQIDQLISKWQATALRIIKHALMDERKFILGDDFSAADISLSCDLMCAAHCGLPGLLDDPVIDAYWNRIKARDSFKSVYPGF